MSEGEAKSRSEYKRLTTLRGEPDLLAENASLRVEVERARKRILRDRCCEPDDYAFLSRLTALTAKEGK
jgi:hypothetical protein